MRILVTGATGFIGAHFVRIATMRGHDVTQLGRRAAGAGSFLAANLATGENLERVTWKNFDAVVHLAAAGVKAAERRWPECVALNVGGTQRLLNSIARAGVTPVFWIAQTFYETATREFPALLENPYIATKLVGSELAREWAADRNVALIFGRIFQAYGPGDASGNVLSYAANCLRRREPATFGSGEGRRDWIFIDDAVEGILATLAATPRGVHSFDLGSGVTTRIRTVVERMAELAGASRDLLRFDPTRDRNDLAIDLRATQPPPDWTPRVGLDDGLTRLMEATAA